jgi:pyruvate/2-oxoacid:ferredoxin oxidoreductase beta subunit
LAAMATDSRSVATTSSMERARISGSPMIMDNFVYGLTKKQTSPTRRLISLKTDPTGAIDQPVNPIKNSSRRVRPLARPTPRKSIT